MKVFSVGLFVFLCGLSVCFGAAGNEFCQQLGYLSPTNRLWTLQSLNLPDTVDYQWNLCGTTPTSCSSTAVVCQTSNALKKISLGSSNTFSILTIGDDLTLQVSISLGDVCAPGYNRHSTLTFHCNSGASSPYVVTNSSTDPCTYQIDIAVPLAMCSPVAPTTRPSPNYCTPNGYTDPTGRTWSLSTYSPANLQSGYDYQLDLCGTEVSGCAPGSVVCRQNFTSNSFFSLGARSSWNIQDWLGNSTTLFAKYTFGDDCPGPAGDSEVQFIFTCTDNLAGNNFYVTEIGPCDYIAYVNVPTARCPPGETTPIPLAQFCKPGGLYHNNIAWSLSNFDSNFPNGTYNYVMNLCGYTTTQCGAGTVLCQENANSSLSVSFGMRSTWGLNPPDITNSMHISYGLGDYCPEGNVDRQVEVYLMCVPSAAPYFHVLQYAPCAYIASITVPNSMCTIIGPTTPPSIPVADWCGYNGFISPTFRKWTLADFNPNVQISGYNYRLNLCGGVQTNCDNSVVLCQETSENSGTAVATRDTYNFQEQLSNDNTLVVGFYLGESCGSVNRMAYVSFHCTDTPGNVTVSEPSMCNYQMDVYVPTRLCPSVAPSNIPRAPWCESYGYLSPSNRLWQLNSWNPSDPSIFWNFKLNLCANAITVCDSSAAICQEDDEDFGYNLGSRNTWNLAEELSTDSMLVIEFSLGDPCGNLGGRQTELRLHCSDTQLFASAEPSTCKYTVDVNVPTSLCFPVTPTPPPLRLPICTSRGYVDAYGKTWSFGNFNPNTASGNAYYSMNLCGTTTTVCGADSVMCQQTTDNAWSLGSRSQGAIDTYMSQPNALAVFYQGGDPCGGFGNRDVMVVFRCVTDNSVSFTYIEITICEYYVSVNVPSSVCYNYQPTNPPVPQAPYCAGGYLSPTGRWWDLGDFNPNDASGQYDFVMNLCGRQNTPCPDQSVMCQMDSDTTGYSLGSRWTYNIQDVNDMTLSVGFTYGDNCGSVGGRTVQFNFHCTTGIPSGSSAMNVSEPSICRYIVDVQVNDAQCEQGGHVATSPFCDGNGYYSPTGRVWNLQNILPAEEQVGYWNYWLDVCGLVQTSCPSGVVLCSSGYGEYFGLRDTWQIIPTRSDDLTLVVNYTLGDYCGVISTDRSAQVWFHCSDDPYVPQFSEPNVCRYRVDINVPTSMCYYVGPTPVPPPPAPWCVNGGYYSKTNRLWNLNRFVPSTAAVGYQWVFDTCGIEFTNCPPNSALCQMYNEQWGWSVAYRDQYTIISESDLDLVVSFGGENCGGNFFRQTVVAFHCSNTSTPYFFVNETSVCRYDVRLNVPYALCQVAQPTRTPLPLAPYCSSATSGGYLSPTNRLWNLRNLVTGYPEGTFYYELNLCGTEATYCGDDSALCQAENDDYFYSLGSRYFWNIIEEESDDITLAVNFPLGDDRFCNRERTVSVYFHCTDAGYLFDVTELGGASCNYRADIEVPTSMCQTMYATPTPGPVPNAPFCNSGYYSPTSSRLWLLNSFNPVDVDPGFVYAINLCGNAQNSQCPVGSVMCQSGTSLALRSSYEIMESLSTSNTLVVNYFLGAWCGAFARSAQITFTCTDANFDFDAQEPSMCYYTGNVSVPTRLCQKIQGTPIPEPEAPYCTGGYRSPTGRLWNLVGFSPNSPQGEFNYVLSACGSIPTLCPGSTILCQYSSRDYYYSLGLRSSYAILPSNSDLDMVVSYSLGDNCGGIGNRRVVITYHCSAGTTQFSIIESSSNPCVYVVQINVPTYRCQPGFPPVAPPSYCTEDGFISATGRMWTLGQMDPNHAVANYNYAMDICGNSPTVCGSTAVCQAISDTSFYSLGSRNQVTMLPTSTDRVLKLRFTNGTSTYCPQQARQVYVNIYCSTNGNYDYFNLTEPAPCIYSIDVNVPPSMCVSIGPTVPPAPYCSSYGYLSPTNRLWQLGAFTSASPSGAYNYALDLCGNQDTVCSVAQGAAVCQEVSDSFGYAVGIRSTWAISPLSTDTTLIVLFSLGDNTYCNGIERDSVVRFRCTDSTALVFMNVNETRMCHYEFDVNVPTRFCSSGRPTQPPANQVPFCVKGGYYSPTARVWDLTNFDFDSATRGTGVYFDPCNLWNYPCSAGAVGCQQNNGVAASNLGLRNTWSILPSSSDLNLSLSYILGDYCTAAQNQRQLIVNLRCVNSTTSNFRFTEPSVCIYQIDMNIPMSMCTAIAPTPTPVAIAPFCDPLYGYYSPTGRLWSLNTFRANDVDDNYNYILNLCGKKYTPCITDSVLCQQYAANYGTNMGVRQTWQILPESTDTLLVVNYGLGDSCGGTVGARQIKLYMNCSNSAITTSEIMDVTEPSMCRYTANITVPTSYCRGGLQPSVPPPPLPAYCIDPGYYSPYGRVWKFRLFNPIIQLGQFAYNLDLCGTDPTLCDPISAFCQEEPPNMAYSLGSRWAYTIQNPDEKTLIVNFAEGDSIYCTSPRQSTVRFHCSTDSSLGGFSLNETSPCRYLADVSVPQSLCAKIGVTPTPQPVPIADYCTSNGYLSATTRTWNFVKLLPHDLYGPYDYVLNVCGALATSNCVPESVACQESSSVIGLSLGNRNSFQILPGLSTDTVLAVRYTSGDYCPAVGGYRQALVYFACTNQPYATFNATETTTCSFTLFVNVPQSMCISGALPTTPPPLPAVAPYCKPEGYLSPANRIWNLTAYDPLAQQQNTSFFVFDLCGHAQTNCPGDSVVCVEQSQTVGYSVAKRSSFQIVDATQDTQFTVSYTLGDYCPDINDTRKATITFICTDDLQGFQINETTTCNYRGTAYVPTALCVYVGTSQVQAASSSSLSSGAIAGISVAVVGAAAGAAGFAGFRVYQARKTGNFKPQID